jgi:hypothetical protein
MNGFVRTPALGAVVVAMLIVAPLAIAPASAAPPAKRPAAACLADLDGVAESEIDLPGLPPEELEPPLLPTFAAWSVLPGPLAPVAGTDGKIHLVYELLFINVTLEPLRIESLQVVDPTRGNLSVGTNRVFAADGVEVTARFRHLTLPRDKRTTTSVDYSNELQSGLSAIVYMDVTFDSVRDVPKAIAHRAALSRGQALPGAPPGAPPIYPDPPTVAVAACAKVGKPAVVVAPPLKGDRWLNGNGCCQVIGPHRYTILPLNGTLRAPEHFAIDYLQLDASGFLYTGDPKVLTNWHFYGADVVSVAPGVVVTARNDLPDQVPFAPPVGVTIDTAEGNAVIVDIGGGRFAAYAHLIPGSVTVRIGDRVKQGQRLGSVGNSGSSSAPHLHFQIVDRPSILDAVGLPFVFDRMELTARLVGASDDVLDALFARSVPVANFAGAGPIREQMPLTLDLMRYR